LPDKFVNNVVYINVSHKENFGDSTMYKFKGMDMAYLAGYQNIYCMDADTCITNYFKISDFFAEFIIIYHSLNDVLQNKYEKLTFDKNKKCMAYVDVDNINNPVYYLSSFFGGYRDNVKLLCDTVEKWNKVDSYNNIVPEWGDESYINKFLNIFFNKDIKTIHYNNNILIKDKGGRLDAPPGKFEKPFEGHNMYRLKKHIEIAKNKMFTIKNGEVVIL
jgi:hypothetical protein